MDREPTTVLVTGASGFMGINVLHALARSPHHVVGLANRQLPGMAAASLSELAPVPSIDHVDVVDAAAVADSFDRHRPDVVIHSAAVTAGPDRERSEGRTIVDVNIGGTQSVLDACTRFGVRRLVHVSSGAVYGAATFGGQPLDETTVVAPTTPAASYYGITKLAAEQIALRHGLVNNLDVVAARLSAVFGPWEYPTGVRDFMSPMLQMVRAARDGQPIRLPSDRPRNWAYSPDAAQILVRLATESNLNHNCYNVCPTTTTTAQVFLNRLSVSEPNLDWAIVDDGQRRETATIGFDADPGLERAPVSAQRLNTDLDPAWARAADAFDAYISWARDHPDWL